MTSNKTKNTARVPKPIERVQLYTLAQLIRGCSRCAKRRNGRPRDGRCDACVRRIYRWTKEHFLEIVLTWEFAKKSRGPRRMGRDL